MSSGFPLPYSIRHSRRAKHLRLVAKPEGIELVVPPTISEARALAFLHKHRDWAERKLSEMRSTTAQSGPAQRLENGSTVPFQGREVPLVIREHTGRRTHIQYDGHFLVSVPAGTENQPHLARNALFNWTKLWINYTARSRLPLPVDTRSGRIHHTKACCSLRIVSASNQGQADE